jgi:hypothetical protein
MDERRNPEAADGTIRVFSRRRNAFIEVPIVPQEPEDDLLAGVMPVMLVTDHPLVEDPKEDS